MSPALEDRHESTQIKTIIIDNYDSYTFNLLQLFENTDNVIVIRNDQFTWEDFSENVLPYFDNVVISPGPGQPGRKSDFGICTQLIEAQLDPNQSKHHRPVFGVCLGHQGIGLLLGGKVVHAPRIMHGRMSQVFVDRCHQSLEYNDVMDNCPSPFWVVRYHSLVVDKDTLPDDLIITAFCYENDVDVEALKNSKYLADKDDDGSKELVEETRFHYLDHKIEDVLQEGQSITIMGFQHKSLPLWGVQFHPESVSTEYGIQMMENFREETYKWMLNKGNRSVSYSPLPVSIVSLSAALPKSIPNSLRETTEKYNLYVKTSTLEWVNPQALVDEIIKNHIKDDQYLSWLDSSRKNSPYSKFSVLSFNPAMTLTYSTLHRELKTRYRNDSGNSSRTEYLQEGSTFFDYISSLLERYTNMEVAALDSDANQVKKSKFQGGLIGYFAYEMKRESMDGYVTPKEQLCLCQHHQQQKEEDNCCSCVEEPDAAFQLVDQFFIFDQSNERIYLCCLDNQPSRASKWIESQDRLIHRASETLLKRKTLMDEAIAIKQVSTDFKPDTDHKSYLSAIEKCIDAIREGESYEICLTTRFRLTLPNGVTTQPTDPSLWRLYTEHLRKNNPAPFSALLMFPRLGILSSSPERFLKVDVGHRAEMKPIKGTIARVLSCVCEPNQCDFGKQCKERQHAKDDEQKQKLWQDVKERAENLMIVDLIRNDLSQVCYPKSVCVPKLMYVETYEKVHHLVSTVRGTIRPNVNSVEVLKKCFPPGSMTGAPKLRSVQILDELEQHRPRGVYSGCLGYFSFNGSADFNVVIRTAVATTKQDGSVHISVGGGGAVTFLSDAEQEWKEAVLKTKSVAPSIKEFLES